MKKRVYLFILIMIVSTCFVNAAHIVTTSNGENSYSTNEGINFFYSITINNTDTTSNSGITQVNIILPEIIKFKDKTNKTDASYQNFSNTTRTLIWTNSASYLIDSGESKYFAFNATATELGNYNITITTFNSTGKYSSYLFVQVNSSCLSNWDCIEWSECLGGNQIRICVDLNLCGDNLTKPIEEKECPIECTTIWSCSDWQPEKCQKDEIQTRTCIDSNNCGTSKEKPNVTRFCKANSLLFFIILVIIIITLIILIAIITIEIWRKTMKAKTTNKLLNMFIN